MLQNNKSLGQHWLKNRAILDEIADDGLIMEQDADGFPTPVSVQPMCLEIGPGLGTLTSSLLKRYPKVLAVEFDQKLANNLPKSFPGKNLEVVNADFLKFGLESIKEPYVAIGNIPYYITSPIIEKLLKAQHRPEKIVLLIQKEVAERIADTKQTLLSLFVQNNADVELGTLVPKEEFTPPPKVDSAVIILTPKAPVIREEVFTLIRLGFSAPRKKLLGNLTSLKSKEELRAIFEQLGLSPDCRPADLSLEDWEKLFTALA